MKKLYLNLQQKSHRTRKTQKILHRRMKCNKYMTYKRTQRPAINGGDGNTRRYPPKSRKIQVRRSNKSKIAVHQIEAPEIVSLTSDTQGITDNTVDFFRHVIYSVDKKHVSIDLSNVQCITVESILYLRSVLAMMQGNMPKNRIKDIRGNYPRDKDCKELICASGFTDFVKTREENIKTLSHILKIFSGEKPEPDDVNKILEFSMSNALIVNDMPKRNASLKNTYSTLLECAGNTFEHAYGGKTPFLRQWWAMAYFKKDYITFSILDNGLGIPNTLKRSFMEKFGLKWKMMEQHKILLDAFTYGERSQLNLPYRGRGLPKIYEYIKDGHIKNLVVVSGKAYINFEKEIYFDLDYTLTGTMFSFEIPVC